MRIFNSPDLFTEKLLDIYGRAKKFPKDLIKVKYSLEHYLKMVFPIIIYDQTSKTLTRKILSGSGLEPGTFPLSFL